MPFGFNTRPQGGQPVQPTTRSVAPTEMQQSSGFTDALKQPEVQAALIQFGINMLNPTYDGFGGQLGRSLGAAGAAAGRASGQKQERAEQDRLRKIQEAELGLAERRVSGAEKRENRLSRGGGLSSMFSKPKPFQTVLFDYAKAKTEAFDSPYFGQDPTALMNDPQIYKEALEFWQKTAQAGVDGGGESAGGGKPSQASVLSEARARIAAGQDRNVIIQKMQAGGYDTTGL